MVWTYVFRYYESHLMKILCYYRYSASGSTVLGRNLVAQCMDSNCSPESQHDPFDCCNATQFFMYYSWIKNSADKLKERLHITDWWTPALCSQHCFLCHTHCLFTACFWQAITDKAAEHCLFSLSSLLPWDVKCREMSSRWCCVWCS